MAVKWRLIKQEMSATAVAGRALSLKNTCQALTPTYHSHGQCKQPGRQKRKEGEKKKPKRLRWERRYQKKKISNK